MTVIEKILARRADLDRVTPGQLVTCEVDMTVLLDLQFGHGWRRPLRLADPDRVAVVMDHAVPAPMVADAEGACGPAASSPSSASPVSTTSATTASATR